MSKENKSLSPRDIERLPLNDLKPYEKNSRTHTPSQIDQIVKSIEEFGFTNPVLVDDDGVIVAGHARVEAAKKMGLTEVPCLRLSGLSKDQIRAYVIADNKLAMNAGWDDAILSEEIKTLIDNGFDVDLTGFDNAEIKDLMGETDDNKDKRGVLADKFLVPPFSVLDTRTALWLGRREKWDAFDFDSLSGRGDSLAFAVSWQPPSVYKAKNAYDEKIGMKSTWEDFVKNNKGVKLQSGTSKFDPVLCELIYRWFCPVGGLVVDPFAGGSVRGLIASILGFKYLGIDIRPEQVQENIRQLDRLKENLLEECLWQIGDSTSDKVAYPECDFFFSCPPYHDLEEYSDLENDISNMDYQKFIEMLGVSIQKGFDSLRENRFACFVVTELRKKDGGYKGFVSDTISMFKKAGFVFYNDIVLVNSCSSAAIRTGKQFDQSRKVGKIHQNVLVFVKGDAREATKLCHGYDSKEALASISENAGEQLEDLDL